MQLISTTNLRGIGLLGGSAEVLLELQGKFKELITDRVEDSAAQGFLSIPALNTEGTQLNWYSEGDGVVQALGALSGPEEREARELVRRIRETLGELARTLKSSADENEQVVGQDLELALSTGDENIYMVGDQPVLAEWGAVRTEASRAPAALVASGAAKRSGAAQAEGGPDGVAGATAAGIAVGGSSARRGWLGWLLALLVVILLLVLLGRCTPGLWGWWQDKPTLAENLAEETRLRRRLSDLRIQLDDARMACASCEEDSLSAPDLPHRGFPELPSPPGGGGAADGSAPPVGPEELCDRMNRELGECDPGKLAVSLAWNALHDMDLGIETPSGELIYYDARKAQGGGLILDYNVEPTERTTEPVESISWKGLPPPGRYRVMVKLHDIDPRQLDIDPIPFTVRVTVGDQTETVSDSIAHGEAGRWKLVHEFHVP
jgi:hypothetical protein